MAQSNSEEAVPFVGRTSELALLLRHVAPGSKCTLIGVHGEAGVGKTRLAAEAERISSNGERAFAWGRWYQGGGRFPYSGFVEAVRALASDNRVDLSAEHVGRLRDLESSRQSIRKPALSKGGSEICMRFSNLRVKAGSSRA